MQKSIGVDTGTPGSQQTSARMRERRSARSTRGAAASRSTAYGTLTLIGAGELMPAMGRAHREALGRLDAAPRAVFLDTTAGFETNADAISAKAVEFYAQRLQTELSVASYRHAGRSSAADTARAVAEVRAANFIFAGPGSPTFALEQWRGSPVWEAVLERFRGGAHLLIASAAAVTVGRYTLPVYEIYKAGQDPYWVEGLNLLGELGLDVAVVPHFNDNSGGDFYDSRFCYMGATRFDALQALLPDDVAILGIDEYTTVTFTPGMDSMTVGGQGSATVIANGEASVWPAGSAVPLERLRSSRREVVRSAPREGATLGYGYALTGAPPAVENGAADEPRSDLESISEYLAGLHGLDEPSRVELLARVEALARTAADAATPRQEPALVDLVLELRMGLRAAKRWDLADRARDELERLGYRIADAPGGSTWERA